MCDREKVRALILRLTVQQSQHKKDEINTEIRPDR